MMPTNTVLAKCETDAAKNGSNVCNDRTAKSHALIKVAPVSSPRLLATMKNYRDKSLHQLTKGTFALHGCRLVHSRFVRVDREHVDLSGGAMLIFSVLPTPSLKNLNKNSPNPGSCAKHRRP